jgi:hypothetical protein
MANILTFQNFRKKQKTEELDSIEAAVAAGLAECSHLASFVSHGKNSQTHTLSFSLSLSLSLSHTHNTHTLEFSNTHTLSLPHNTHALEFSNTHTHTHSPPPPPPPHIHNTHALDVSSTPWCLYTANVPGH